jgi:Rrf2 family iron-sulfur cluster assembly transcriptional regulator
MRLTTKGRFAVTAMLDMALRQQTGPVSLAAIGQRQQISVSYLEQLFSRLRQQGLVRSTRGPGGGYTLARPAEDINLADIFLAVEGTDKAEGGQGGAKAGSAPHEYDEPMTRGLWDSLSDKMLEHMRSITLRQLVLEQLAKGVSVEAAPVAKRPMLKQPGPKPMRSNAPNSVFALGAWLATSRS